MTPGATPETILQPRPDVGPARPWAFPATERTQLDNGAAVLLCHLPHRLVTSVQVFVAAPRDAEPEGLDGVAEIMARSLREGTATMDASEFADELERHGATLDCTATNAGIRLVLGVPSSRLEPALSLLGDVLASPRIPDREVRRLVSSRLDAIRSELADPRARAAMAARTLLFDASERLSRPDSGDADTVPRIDRAAVVAHHRAFLHPGSTTVVVAGDLSGGAVDGALQRTLGRWDDRGTAPLVTPRTPRAAPERRGLLVHRPGSPQTELRLVRVGPTRREPTWRATMVGAFALGGGLNSRLMQTLREERGYTYGVYANATSIGTTGVLQVGGAVETGVTAAAIEEALRVIAELASGGVTREERDLGVDSLGAVPRRLESPSAVASMVMSAVEEGLPDEYWRAFYKDLDATPVEEVTAAVRRDWRPGLNIVAVGDSDVIAAPLRELGVCEFDAVS